MHGASFLSWESIFEACTTFMWTARPTQIVWQFATPLLKKKSDSARCQDLSLSRVSMTAHIVIKPKSEDFAELPVMAEILPVVRKICRQYFQHLPSQLPLILALHLPAVHPQVFQLLRGNGVVHGCSGCPEKEPESRPAAGRFRSLRGLKFKTPSMPPPSALPTLLTLPTLPPVLPSPVFFRPASCAFYILVSYVYVPLALSPSAALRPPFGPLPSRSFPVLTASTPALPALRPPFLPLSVSLGAEPAP